MWAATMSQCAVPASSWFHWALYALAALLMVSAAARIQLRGWTFRRAASMLGPWPLAALLIVATGGSQACVG